MAKLISGKEFITVLEISDSINKILEYAHGLTEEELLKDDKTIDAIFYNLIFIGKESKYLSKLFTNRYNKIEWEILTFLFSWHEKPFPNIDLFDILFDPVDGLIHIFKKIQAFDIEKEVFKYLNSFDFLSFEMTMRTFFKWILSDGKLYIDSWVYKFEKDLKININSKILSKQKIADAWKVHDSSQPILRDKIFITVKDLENHLFSLDEYRIALEYIFTSSKGTVNKKGIMPKAKNKYIQDEELPWDTDYPFSIRTKNSIWTVRNK
jgi:uncharacterized protein with HEPN domain